MPHPSQSKRFRVIPSEQGLTLRSMLSRRLREFDRTQTTALIRAGGVYVNRLRIRIPNVVVAPGERITVYTQALDAEPLTPEQLVFVHRSPEFVILDKAPGIPVSPIRETAIGCLSEALVRLLESEGHNRPYVGVVHRLDRGASGLVLFTTRDIANKSLHQQFRDHDIHRGYRIRVTGAPPPTVTCDVPLTKLRDGGVSIGESANAKSARTHFRLLASFPDPDGGTPEHLLEAVLETGRTHQIRAHASHLGFPVMGDHRYGDHSNTGSNPPEVHDRLYLHAQTLEFRHPISDKPIRVEAPLPDWARV